MKSPLSTQLAGFMVRTASLLVPRRDRSAWKAEWTAELWHLCHPRCCDPGDAPDADPLKFSFGAFHDAFWVRCDRIRSSGLPALQSGSAARCALFLGATALAALSICLCMPGARSALLPLSGRGTGNLVMISSSGFAGTRAPSIRFADYQEWTTDTAALFTEIAFYRPTAKSVHLPRRPAARLSIAQASDNLLQLLNLPVAHAGPSVAEPGQSRLILTRSAWQRIYGGDPYLVGRTADIDGQPVLIAAVMPDSNWRFAGRIDGVLLEDPRNLAALPSTTKGFVIARIRPSAFPAPRGGWRKMVETRDGVTHGFDCISVDHMLDQPVSVFLFALLLASLALPATTALPLGDYPMRNRHLPGSVDARRWIFLAAKFLLVLVIVDICSTGLAYGFSASDPIRALYIQLGTAFPSLLFAFRWILQDQRRRCPECLRLLSNPARVGQASCNFLSWNGTELFCARGHGFLHIPELPTSWFSTQRWLCLDPSWLCLFPETRSPSPGMV
ncbi:MAG: hypothetical protein WBP95_14305 [Acidobacteriaceae bacterium]